MFVLLDADDGTVQEHLSELDAALVAEDQPRYNSATDTIARLIPKWSIETWILFLISHGASEPPLSEDEPYKSSTTTEQWSELIPQASATLYDWSRLGAKLPENLIDSLRCGLNEIPRAFSRDR